jgi:hypothetical protein
MRNSGSAAYRWHLTYPPDHQTVLATYVLENLEAVEEIVRRASVRLRQETGDGSFDAYATGHPQRVRDQCRAIYEELRALRLTYSVEAPGSVPSVQVVRLADEVLRDKRGSCLDLVLLLAGALLRVGIFPLLTVVGPAAEPDHIVLGYWLKERTPGKGEVSTPVLTQKEWRTHRDEMAFVESTDVAADKDKPFADAEEDAQAHIPPLSGNTVWYAVDVRAARALGIRPLLRAPPPELLRLRQVEPRVQEVGWITFCRELPKLLEESPHMWVAFHGERQVALGPSKLDVYRQLETAACPLDEVVVRRIEPVGPSIDLREFRASHTRPANSNDTLGRR